MEEERKLDKNQIIGFIIIGILLIGFSWWNSKNAQEQIDANPTTEQVEENIPSQEGLEQAFEEAESSEPKTLATVPSDSLEAFYAEKVYTIENDLLEISMLGKGAQFKNVRLKEFQTYDSLPLQIIDGNVLQNFSVGSEINSADKIYNGRIETTDSSQTLYLTTNTNEGELTLWYRLRNGNYQLEAGIGGKDLAIQNGSELGFKYAQDAIRMEKSRKNELRTTTIYYWEAADQDYDYLSLTSSDDEEEVSNVKWFGHKQQFFSTIIEANSGYSKARIGQAELIDDEFTKRMATAAVFKDKVGADFNVDYSIYFGPNDYSILKSYAASGYNQIIDFGWGIFGWINKSLFIPLFSLLSGFFPYGIAIIIMTILVRLVLSPVLYKSYLSQAKMKILKPEIAEISEKYKDNAMKKQKETMALYNKAGANPMSGCLPAFVQLPVFYALFMFFPTAFELRQKSFLWADDLSSYDVVAELPFHIPFYGDHVSLFPILAAVAIFFYMKMTTGQQVASQPTQEGMPDMGKMMKYMIYFSPLMMLVFFNNYASGLSLYYFISNLITIGIMLVIKNYILDEDKIHAQMQENKKKPKKQGKFAKKMAEMMEKAEEQKRVQNRKK